MAPWHVVKVHVPTLPSLKKTLAKLPPRPVSTIRRGAKAMLRKETPLLTQLVVIRRCNLSCGYCNEYDDFSDPVPTDVLLERVDHLASLGNLILTLTGGEPFMHPELDRIVERGVKHGMIVTSISNAYPVTRKRIEQMNRAGLTLLQVSVDNIEPNDVSQKSWSKIKKRLLVMQEHAQFDINVNAVLGSSPPPQTRVLIDEIRALGFYMTVGLMHDHSGQIDAGLIGDQLPEFYEEMLGKRNTSVFHQFGEGWERKMLRGGHAPYKCRAGSRYLYVDERGLVSYCSQRRNEPGIPILDYQRSDLLREFETAKGCEDACTIACVRRASSLDEWRSQNPAAPSSQQDGSRVHLPLV
ncbi:MAG: radical SAM protein [Myxococcota bacterium]